jgi:hypothetical protein
MIKKEGTPSFLFVRMIGPSADTYFLIIAANNQLNVGCENIRIGIGKGLYGFCINIYLYRKRL